MREIKFIGLEKRGNDTRNYRYSIFICPSCDKEVIRKTKDGKNKLDNRIGNLTVMSQSEHNRYHAMNRRRDDNGKFTN